MRSLLRTVPLLGALLISVAPVHASRTIEELTEPCYTSEEAITACKATGEIMGSYHYHDARCELWKAEVIPPEVFDVEIQPFDSQFFNEDEEKAMWNAGVKAVLEDYPNCPIKLLR